MLKTNRKMLKYYKDAQGVILKKYRNLLGQYILVLSEESGTKTKIFVGKALYDLVAVGSKQTIGHIKGRIINIRPGFHL